MKKGLLVTVVIILIVLVGGCGAYKSLQNGLNTSSKEVDNAWASVQADYQRRADLIPNLVATVKGAADFEKSTYVQVAQARAGDLSQALKVNSTDLTPQKLEDIQKASTQAQSAAKSMINVVMERYPDLKANTNFLGLQDQLEGTENRINTSRKRYNDVVTEYNTKVSNFPTSLVAGSMGFKEKPLFQADAAAQNASKVDFSK